jgi:hypothetical protein
MSSNKTKSTIFMLGIWAAALGSAGALVFSLTRPLVPPPSPFEDAPISHASTVPEGAQPAHVTAPRELHASNVHVNSFAPKAKPRDITEMHCSDWRPLAMGPVTQGVRYCE